MGKINARNFQLNLAFNDQDLRTPKHDEIMHWLTAWTQNTANIRPLYAKAARQRSEHVEHRLDAQSAKLLEPLREYEKERILSDLNRQFSGRVSAVKEAWPKEPERRVDYCRMQWEPPLKNGRGIVGFCDLHCQYNVSFELEKVLLSQYSLASVEPVPRDPEKPAYSPNRWAFALVTSGEWWRQPADECNLYFEVKTEIRSVGELMRQLQLYRSTDTFQWSTRNRLVVVAPANNEAASVCEAHGISFVDYRPN